MKLSRYAAALLERNRRVNLTGAKTLDALVPQLLDSLTIAPFMRESHIDIGSGGGLPAIPAAIVSGSAITLIEATSKKATFLVEITGELGLNAKVLAARAETVARDAGLRESFQSASARAVATASTVAELTLPFLRIGGEAILQRGRFGAAERAALQDALLILGGRVAAEHAIAGDRRIVLLEKSTATPERFPRRPGVPTKKPLGWRSFHGKPTGETE
ncbi:MAG: 16S rRNA (guanine(527)-N(7))-methyltransferase RsmG [Candidatus Eremiobacteraeota bacterium]|nr:16S rRNA (guanine(527)-N(7))-methyltransferase RsmG [Candidatus Eremiobacteraeota bacterium]